MKAIAPDHPRLSALSLKFDAYRQHRSSKRSPIPKDLWKEAAALAEELSPTRVARALKLDSNSLKRNMPSHSKAKVQAKAELVRVAPVVFSGTSASLPSGLEIIRDDGTRLCLTSVSTTALETIVAQFLQARGGAV